MHSVARTALTVTGGVHYCVCRGCMRSVARAALTATGVARTTVHIGTGVVWHATKRTSV